MINWLDSGHWEGTATVVAAVVAAIVILVGFAIDRRVRRNARRSEVYAGALQTVHDYLEAPYRIRRSSGSREERFALVTAVSDIQSRLSYFDGLLAMVGPEEVHTGFQALMKAARAEAGTAMTASWSSPPTRQDDDVPLDGPLYLHPESDSAREELIKLMQSSRK